MRNINSHIERNSLRSEGKFNEADREEMRHSFEADRRQRRERYKEDRARRNLPEDPNKVRFSDPKRGKPVDINIKDFNSGDQYWSREGRASFLRQAKNQRFKVMISNYFHREETSMTSKLIEIQIKKEYPNNEENHRNK